MRRRNRAILTSSRNINIFIDEEGRLIRTHLIFPQNNRIPSRFLAGDDIQAAVNKFMSRHANLKWSVVRLGNAAALLVPDYPAQPVIPISPATFLDAIEGPDHAFVPEVFCGGDVSCQLNALMARDAKRWVLSASREAIEEAVSEAR